MGVKEKDMTKINSSVVIGMVLVLAGTYVFLGAKWTAGVAIIFGLLQFI